MENKKKQKIIERDIYLNVNKSNLKYMKSIANHILKNIKLMENKRNRKFDSFAIKFPCEVEKITSSYKCAGFHK